LWVSGGMSMEGARPVTAANKRAVLERLGDSAVVVDSVEAFMLMPDVRGAEPGIALAAELGARTITVVNAAIADDGAAAQQLTDFCALAHRYGLLVGLEPISMGATRTPADGLRIVQRSGATNARLVIDVLHVVRTGTPLSDVAAIDPALIGSFQICDGPLQITASELVEEASSSRMVPGSGDFPLEEFLRIAPASVPLGLEVPLRTLREGGMSARDRTRQLVEATRALQQRVADHSAGKQAEPEI
jgi:sugar phosphate isomerase/epimerase